MTETQILETVSRIVADTVGLGSVALRRTTTAADVDGWDSLAHVRIMVAIERAFAVRFRTGEMASIATVGDLVDRIAARLSRPA